VGRSQTFSWLLFVPAAALYAASLYQPALKAPAGVFRYTGLNCLLLGWLGLLGRPAWALPWVANVLFAISLVRSLLRRPGREALILSLIAIPLALLALLNHRIEMDEAGNMTDVVPGAGFYLWLASIMSLAAAQMGRLAMLTCLCLTIVHAAAAEDHPQYRIPATKFVQVARADQEAITAAICDGKADGTSCDTCPEASAPGGGFSLGAVLKGHFSVAAE